MLVLSRKKSESIHLGDEIEITIIRVAGDRVRLGIKAPEHLIVLRRELSGTSTPQSGEEEAGG